MNTTVLVWNKIDDRTWQAGGLGSFYEIRRYSNQRDHFSLFRRVPENPVFNTEYIISTLDIEVCKVRAQEHLDQSANRIAKV